MILNVEVTPNDNACSTPGDAHRCSYAKAIKRADPDILAPKVGKEIIKFLRRSTPDIAYEVPTPAKVQTEIMRLDMFGEFTPGIYPIELQKANQRTIQHRFGRQKLDHRARDARYKENRRIQLAAMRQFRGTA